MEKKINFFFLIFHPPPFRSLFSEGFCVHALTFFGWGRLINKGFLFRSPPKYRLLFFFLNPSLFSLPLLRELKKRAPAFVSSSDPQLLPSRRKKLTKTKLGKKRLVSFDMLAYCVQSLLVNAHINTCCREGHKRKISDRPSFFLMDVEKDFCLANGCQRGQLRDGPLRVEQLNNRRQ